MYTPALAAAALIALTGLSLPQTSANLPSTQAPSQVEGWPLVNGNHWKASSRQQKRAYLLGLANTLTIDQALEAKHGTSGAASESDRLNDALTGNSLDYCITRIDDWYHANPGRTNLPVIGAAWLAIVKGQS